MIHSNIMYLCVQSAFPVVAGITCPEYRHCRRDYRREDNGTDTGYRERQHEFEYYDRTVSGQSVHLENTKTMAI